jgi:hypothetical protein
MPYHSPYYQIAIPSKCPGDAGDQRRTNSLMLEHLDLGCMEDQGTVPGAYLTEMLSMFGKITRFHLFSLLSVACVQFQDSDGAEAVRLISHSSHSGGE